MGMISELEELLGEIDGDPTPINYILLPDGTSKEASEMTEAEWALFGVADDDPDESDEGEGGE